MIEAAGGVVWRPSDSGVLVALVHRPHHQDWSLPKGKVRRGEHPLLAAVREVAEETGVTAVPQMALPTVGYQVRRPGSPDAPVAKRVRYWSMRAVSWVDRPPDREVDLVRWVPLTQTDQVLSYADDRRVVAEFARRPMATGLVALVTRPTESLGAVARILAPVRVISAPDPKWLTVATGLGHECATAVEVVNALASVNGLIPATAAVVIRQLARSTGVTIVCGPADLAAALMRPLPAGTGRAAEPTAGAPQTAPGVVLLSFAGDALTGTCQLDPPAASDPPDFLG